MDDRDKSVSPWVEKSTRGESGEPQDLVVSCLLDRLRLESHHNRESAHKLGRSIKTVERNLMLIRKTLAARADADG